MEEILGLRRVSGLAGLRGAAFLVGEVDRAAFVGDTETVEEGLTADCDPICSHCFSRSATLPVFLPTSPEGIGFVVLGSKLGGGRGDSPADAGIAIGLRIGNGGCDFGVGRTGAIKPSGGGPSISTDTLG